MTPERAFDTFQVRVSKHLFLSKGDQMKICSKCEKAKNTSCFYKDKIKKDGLTSYCKDCAKQKRLVRYEANKEKEKENFKEYHKENKHRYKNSSLKNLYGISLDILNQMKIDQLFSCLICKTHEDNLSRGLFVDHCHSSGKVRGLLCQSCNTMLGAAKDNQSILQEGIKYLYKNKE